MGRLRLGFGEKDKVFFHNSVLEPNLLVETDLRRAPYLTLEDKESSRTRRIAFSLLSGKNSTLFLTSSFTSSLSGKAYLKVREDSARVDFKTVALGEGKIRLVK